MLVRSLTKQSLARAIRIGERENYNRQAEWRLLDDMDPNYLVRAEFLMVHEHKQFRPADPHARLGIQVKLKAGGADFGFLDVPLEFWQSLPAYPTGPGGVPASSRRSGGGRAAGRRKRGRTSTARRRRQARPASA